ncbi:MAG TPA: transglycosylase SLT domain-containing protein [Bacteroidia bacterium]|jgi:membrane-bound lytic murein transglycosylase D|nr:transglycosylase SLT domain-containing protein [Bacteroidia bacterium]
MLHKKLNIVLFFIAALLTGQAIAMPHDTLAKKDSALFADDPIAANLDSLSHLHFFEKGYDFVKSPTYHFSHDSIPWYSDKEFEDRMEKLDANSPFDLVYNDVVKQYIEMYAVRKRNLTSRMLALSKLYFPMMEQTLDRYKMPLELKYLAVVESAMNPAACSKAGARGLWQFMYTTGKLYNLQVSSYVDERNDPIKSTIAACEYLKFLHGMFNDWQLALAAYNCGPVEVSKAIRRSGGKMNFWEIRPYLPKETQGYVPAFIAVNYVMNYATSHNIYPGIPNATFFDVDTVCVHAQLSFTQIASYLNVPYDEISYLNPCYKLGVIPFSSDGCYTVCLPVSKVGAFVTNEKSIYNLIKRDTLSSQQMLALQHNMPEVEYHRVRRGEHLSTVANRYHCTVRELKEWNGLASADIHPGQHLMVYVNRRGAKDAVASKKGKAGSKKDVYIVQNGDTLYHISQSTGIPIATLKKLNHIAATAKLSPGTKIKLASN